MRYVFIGAGAVGSALGGLLAHTDSVSVLLVARGDHARAMQEKGLSVRCPDTAFTVPVEVATTSGEVELTVDDVLVLTTKTQQAEAALTEWADVPVRDRDRQIVGRASDILPVLTASNGVASEQIALRYFSRVFAVCVWFPVVLIEPGEVIVRGGPLHGVFHIGRFCPPADGLVEETAWDNQLLDVVQHDWYAASCLVQRPNAVMNWKYRKLLSNLGNVLQALLGDASNVSDIAQAAEAEAREILRAAAVPVVPDDDARTGWEPPGMRFTPVPGQPDKLGGSSWQSLVRGTGTIETDFLNGEIALIARHIGRHAPINAALTALARHAARQRLQPGAMNVVDVRTMVELGTIDVRRKMAALQGDQHDDRHSRAHRRERDQLD